VAVVGGRGEKTANRILNRAVSSVRQPGSTMKPIAVYAPAVQLNLIHFSSQIPDCYITLRNGQKWPKNYGQSSPRDSGMSWVDNAIQNSKNTVPAQIMQSLTPQRAFNFVTGSLNLSSLVTSDKKGNTDIDYSPMCLGGLTQGVYPREMAAAYQIFGNGGQYTAAHGVLEIRDHHGNAVYTADETPRQVIKPATATIMNYLLQGVVKGNGTGAGVGKTSVPVAAKTGTGKEYAENWCVGVTPQYSCAVYHGPYRDDNVADELFGAILQNLPEHTVTAFPACDTVHKAVYCTKSGLMYGSGCTGMYVGYYDEANPPAVCKAH
jgi:penicillin-binding protein 1A